MHDNDDDPLVGTWLGALFSGLEKRGALYAALRVDTTLFRPNCELDLLVHPGSLWTVLDEIRDLYTRFSHLRIAYWSTMPGHGATVVLAWAGRRDQWEHYFFDIRCGIRKQRMVLLDGTALSDRTTTWDPALGIRRLNDDLERALLMIRNTLDHREPSPRHLRIIAERDKGDLAEAMRALGWSLVSGGESAVIRKRPFGRISFRFARASARYAVGALRGRVGKRTLGVNVVIYGPDGVGKSTQAELLAHVFRGIRLRRVHVYHHLVELTSSAHSPPPKTATVKTRIYRSARRRWTMNTIVLLSYLKKLWVVLSRLRPMLNDGHVLIHDRYLLDVFQKLYKARGIRLSRLERLLSPLTPREPFVIVLHAPPDIILGRTAEMTAKDVTASYDLLFDCLSNAGRRLEGWTMVDSSQPVEKVHLEIIEHILQVQTQRAASLRIPRV